MNFKALILVLSVSVLTSSCGGNPSDSLTVSPTRYAQALSSNTVSTYAGNRSNYVVTKTLSGYTVKNVQSGNVDSLSNVTSIKFDDVTVNLVITDKAQTLSAANLKSLIELYVAFFNRVPDADGLAYWIDQFNAGLSIDQIANSFYSAAVQYSELTGYSASMSDADFVRVIYKNVLGRTGATSPPDADIAYWATSLASGNATKGSLVRTMLDSAHSFKGNVAWGWVADLLDNKVSVANNFAIVQGLNYNSAQESIARTMAIASAVTATDTSAATALIGSNSSVPDSGTTPTANAGPNQTVTTQTTVVLDATASTASVGKTLTYAWTLSTKPTSSSTVLLNATTAKPTFTPDVAGSYVVTLVVNDGTSTSAPSTVTITATAAPQASLQLYSAGSLFGENLESFPYSVAATSSQTILGSNYATVQSFKLAAIGGSFTITDLTAFDSTGRVTPKFSGLSNGQVISAGSTVTFSLLSPLTNNTRVTLTYRFTVVETGKTFQYVVRLLTN